MSLKLIRVLNDALNSLRPLLQLEDLTILGEDAKEFANHVEKAIKILEEAREKAISELRK